MGKRAGPRWAKRMHDATTPLTVRAAEATAQNVGEVSALLSTDVTLLLTVSNSVILGWG